MTPTRISADKETDVLYRSLRTRHGGGTWANGYRFAPHFRWEQRLLLDALRQETALGTLLDIGCGTGLLVRPLIERGESVIGLDYNFEACRLAAGNGLAIVRGDAYDLPFRPAAADHIVCCQFLNQQPHAKIERLMTEASRVLRPNGRFLLVWRNGRSLLHRLAHFTFRLLDRVRGEPDFPQVFHDPMEVAQKARAAGFAIDFAGVTCPLLPGAPLAGQGVLGRLAGASFFLVLRKPKHGEG